MPSRNDGYEKYMWSFLVKSIKSGKYGHKLYVLKKLEDGYILAIKAKHQGTLSKDELRRVDELRREWRVILDYRKLKGQPLPNTSKKITSKKITSKKITSKKITSKKFTSKKFTSKKFKSKKLSEKFTDARSAFFNALLKCRCLSMDQGSFTHLKDISEYGFHPEKYYKYYLFTCEPNSMPDWPVNLIEEPITSGDEQEVPHSPNNILEQAMQEAEVQVTAYNVEERDGDESRSSSIDEVSMKTVPTTPTSVTSSNCNEEFIDPRNIMQFPIENVAQNSTEIVQCNLPKDSFPYMENNEGNVNNANHDNAFIEVSRTDAEIMRVFNPVAHAAEQDPPGANAVALFTSQQVESGEVPSNPEDTPMDSPETPQYAFNEGSQMGQNYTPESSPLRDTTTCDPMWSDLKENSSVPLGSQPLVSDAPLEYYTQCDETQTQIDPLSFLNLNENSADYDMDVISPNNNSNEELFYWINEPPESFTIDNDLGEFPREFDEMDMENVSMDVPRGY